MNTSLPAGGQEQVLSGAPDMLYELVEDVHLPKILFLCTNPSKVAQLEDGSSQGLDEEFRITTDRAFKRALEEKCLLGLRGQFRKYCMDLSDKCQLNPKSERDISLTANFSKQTQNLGEDEVSILQFVEILTMFDYPVSSAISKASENIIVSSKLPVYEEKEGKRRKKKYLVYSENKVVMQLCDKLTEEEVCLMFDLLRREGQEDFATVKEHLDLAVDARELKATPGLKDTAFYYFILTLIRHKILNRLYTHALINIFESMKQSRIDIDLIDDLVDQVSRYPLASNPPGLCIILNVQKDREGAQHDGTNVKELFENVFKYDVIVETDPTKEIIQDIITELKASRNQFYDSLVVWFMGHGDKTYVQVIDGEIHRREDLIVPITEIDWLFMKPKLFFFQACAIRRPNKRKRSKFDDEDLEDLGMETDVRTVLASESSTTWRNTYGPWQDVCNTNPFADTLVSFATKWYEEASRGQKGSLFVDTLADQLREYGHKEPIESVLRRTHYNVNTVKLPNKQRKQTPYFESSLQKVFIFPEFDDVD